MSFNSLVEQTLKTSSYSQWVAQLVCKSVRESGVKRSAVTTNLNQVMY